MAAFGRKGDSARAVEAGLGFVYACRGFREEVRMRDERFQEPSGGSAESSSMDDGAERVVPLWPLAASSRMMERNQSATQFNPSPEQIFLTMTFLTAS